MITNSDKETKVTPLAVRSAPLCPSLSSQSDGTNRQQTEVVTASPTRTEVSNNYTNNKERANLGQFWEPKFSSL